MTVMARFMSTRSPREKGLMAALGGLVVVWLAVTQIWAPVQALRQEIAARIPRMERALAQVQVAPKPMAVAADTRAAPAIITEAAETFGLRISRLQPLGSGAQLTLEDAPFETVLLWIEALHRENALRLVDLTLTRRPSPGVVGATLTLER